MATERHIIIGTAGHVDHGKTTLIRALTGIETDRLAEEKARGMTIDLGFAFMELPGNPPILAGIVDVPGHERFVKNMLAGAGGVDVALVVVAADEGPMPQTREHLDILTVLGIQYGVVALTKTDTADAELAELAADATREALSSTPLANAPIIPVSAETGEGLEKLKATLAQVAASVPLRDEQGPFRLPVDRVFSLPGVGTVVTGTLIAGMLHVGDAAEVQPQGIATKARTLQAHNRKIETATSGMRVAVNLPGVEVGEIERGAVLSPPGFLDATKLADIQLSLLPDAPRPVRHRERVRVHLGAGEALARVLLLAGNEVSPGTTDAPAQLLFETPVAPARGERFVLRTYSPARAVGGGSVLDANPARRYRRGDAAALTLFEARGSGEVSNAVYAALAARNQDYSVAEIATATGLSEEITTIALESLVDEGRAEILTNGRYFADTTAERLNFTTQKTLSTFHKQNPYRKAMPRNSLRAPLAKVVTIPDFNAVILWLVAQGIVVSEGASGIRLPEHEVIIPPRWQKAADEMLEVYRAAKFSPPSPDNFQANYPRDIHVGTILNILAENGELVSIGEDVYLSTETVTEAKDTIRRLAATPEGITVATLRDATGSSRKITLPLLEYLDGIRFTRRQGDARVLVEQ